MWEDYLIMPGQDDWWQRYTYDTTQRGLDILGARYGDGDYYSPDDPRFRNNRSAGGYVAPTGQVGISPGTVSHQGFQVNWWATVLGGVLVGAFLLGKRGR